MTQTRLPRLSEMTADEQRMIDAYLATGSFSDAARVCHCNRATVTRVYWRYQGAIRELVKVARDAEMLPSNN
jgi:hypothetical protein